MKSIARTNRFVRDMRRMVKRGRDVAQIKKVVHLLVDGAVLPDRLRDHALSGDWHGVRDCHIEPDWLLLYRTNDEEVFLERTGSHADLF